MFCEHCGNMLPEKAKFCDSCGAPVKREPQNIYTAPISQQSAPPAYPQPYEQVQPYTPNRQEKPSVGFVEAIRLYFLNYANFYGRSRRSEYWYAALFTGILNTLVAGILPDLGWLVTLALFVPNLSICVRRLHDIGKSGWYYFMSFIPLVGGILMLIYMCRDSEGDNYWGESPKY